jgi:hypothetical protein
MNKCLKDNLQKNDILSFGCQATTIASWIKEKEYDKRMKSM